LFFDESSIGTHSLEYLFVALRDEATLWPTTSITPAGGGGNERRFRFPIRPNARTSRLTPQLEDIEFEMSLECHSDNELNSLHESSRKMTMEEWHQSKDNAWVDILP